MSELEPCPFCGDDMKFADWTRNAKDSLEVLIAPVCIGRGCGARGSMWATREEAIAAWNTRSTPLRDPGGDVEAVARIIDPGAFADTSSFGRADQETWQQAKEDAITKADAILAALPSQAAGEGGWLPIDSAPKDGRYIEVTRVGVDPWGVETTHVVQWDDDWWQVHDGKNWHALRGAGPTFWRDVILPPAPSSLDKAE